jgi:ribonuclease P protein component
VSKRIGNAVNRNKIKRRLKAAAAEAGVEGGWDLIVIARQGARSAGYWELRRSLRRLLGRARVIGRKDQAGANVGRGAR